MNGVPYTQVVQICKRVGFVEVNHFHQNKNAILWRAAVRRAVKKGLLRKVKSSKGYVSRYVIKETDNDLYATKLGGSKD